MGSSRGAPATPAPAPIDTIRRTVSAEQSLQNRSYDLKPKHSRIRFLTALLLLLSLLLPLAGCGTETEPQTEGTETSPPSTEPAATEPVEPAEPEEPEEPAEPVIGQSSREFLTDYLGITPSGEHEARVLFLNVGKGDAILVSIDGKVWMIDTGLALSPPLLCAGMRALGADRLEGVFITHTDGDHIGGLKTLLSCAEVGAVYTSTISADWKAVDKAIDGADAPRVTLDPGAVVPAGEGVWFEVLGPYRYNTRDDNNSLVLRLRVNGTTTLFTGDMMKAEEKTLLSEGIDLDCDLLKVGHHGKKDATSDEFAEAATPIYAIISASTEEESDAAHSSVIKTLKRAGATVVVTEEVSLGVLAEITTEGRIIIREQKPLDAAAPVSIRSISKSDQLVILENSGTSPVDLSGWWLASGTGKELLRFPEGTVIAAGGTFSIGCRDSSAEPDLRWNEAKVWHKSKTDIAYLYDAGGRLLCELDSE